ncbi:hypothetical protein Pan97_36090 [Bremerella volcania]|uniref:Uncharacterized protein n=1 Tax=Bremerella volcania TaxID=2527984 RepID=A0A518CBF5_9BACT|nr:hypothetical protein [Bremerella volcania]QDU76557.1 hypothetical protein Pan97_36090 [Bremerella volcania]
MLTTLKKIWNDERGFVSSMELILIATLTAIGLIVGLVAFRDSLVQELGDTASAVGELNQSYAIFVGNSDNTDPEDGPVVIGPNAVSQVTVQRDFLNSDDEVVVSVTSSFQNFRYNDRTDVGDGPDLLLQPPATIVSLSDAAINEGESLSP